jgi:hypothetical protein
MIALSPRGSRSFVSFCLFLAVSLFACSPTTNTTTTTRSPSVKASPSSSSSSTSSTPTTIEDNARAFVDELAHGQWDHAKTPFDAKMTEAMPSQQLHALWTKLESQAGAFRHVDETKVEPKDAYRIAHVTCTFEKARLIVRVVFDQENKVAGLFVAPAPLPATAWSAPSYVTPAA